MRNVMSYMPAAAHSSARLLSAASLASTGSEGETSG